MARRRFFVGEISEGKAELEAEEAHHLVRVLRAEVGQRYEISDNRSVWLAEITEVAAKRVVFRVVEPVESRELPVRVALFASLIKFDRFEWMVEKATELGVAAIVPVAAERSDKGLFEAARKRVERWRRIARESSQQSRRASGARDLDAAAAGLRPWPAPRASGIAWKRNRAPLRSPPRCRANPPPEARRRCWWVRRAAGRMPNAPARRMAACIARPAGSSFGNRRAGGPRRADEHVVGRAASYNEA